MAKKKRNKRREEPQKKQSQKQERDAHLQKLTTYTGIGVLAIVIIAVGFYLFANRSGGSSGLGDFDAASQPSLGDPDAPVTVVEFGDFKCPACKTFHGQSFRPLRSEYIEKGHVRFFFLNFPIPLGDDSYTAADAAECVYHQDEGAFWDFYDAVYEFQGPERETWATPDALMNLVRDYVEADLNEQELRRCIVDQTYRGDVERDKQIGLNAGVRGTPTVYLNGEAIPNWSYSNLQSAIEERLPAPSQ